MSSVRKPAASIAGSRVDNFLPSESLPIETLIAISHALTALTQHSL